MAMPQSNANTTPRPARNAFFAGAVLSAVALVASLTYGWSTFKANAWQMWVVTGLIVLLGGCALLCMRLARRQRIGLGVGLLIGSVLLLLLASAALLGASSPGLSLAALLIPAFIALQTLSRRQTLGVVALSFAVGAAILSAKQWSPFPTFVSPKTSMPLPVSIGLIMIVFVVVLTRSIRRYSLRTKLTVALLSLALLPWGAVWYLGGNAVRNALAQSAGTNVQSSASLQANVAANLLRRHVSTLQVFGASKLIQDKLAVRASGYSGTAAEIQARMLELDQQWTVAPDTDLLVQARLTNEVAGELRKYQQVSSGQVEVLLTDHYGALVGASSRPSDFYQADETWWQAAYNTGKGNIFIGQPTFDQISQTQAMTIAVPVYGNDSTTVVGVLRSTYDIYEILQLLQSNDIAGEQSEILLPDNRLVEAEGIGETVLAEQVALVKAGADSFVVGEWEEKNQFIGTTTFASIFAKQAARLAAEQSITTDLDKQTDAAIAALGWTFIVDQPQDTALARIGGDATQTALVTGLLGFLLIPAAFSISSSLARPITHLTRVAERVAGGDLKAQATVTGTDETSILAASFNTMTGRLRETLDGMERQVDERRQAEVAARNAQRFYQSVLENIPNMVFVKDAQELRFVSLNKAGQELIGVTQEDVVGKNDNDFFPPDQAEWFIAKDRAVLEGGVLFDIPEEPFDSGQGMRYLHTKKIPIMDEQGKPLYLLGISDDITERKRAEAELRSSRKRASDQNLALQASAEISQRVSLAESPAALMTEVVEGLRSTFGYYHAQVYLFDAQDEFLVLTGSTGDAGEKMLAREHKLPNGKGLVGRAASTNSIALVPNVDETKDWLPNPLLPNTRAEVAVPIAVGAQVLGVLDVQHDVVGELDEEDARLLLAIARQLGVALENARGLNEIKQGEAERERLLQVAQQGQRTLATILDKLPVGVLVADATAKKLLIANEASVNILGPGVDPKRELTNSELVYKAYLSGSNDEQSGSTMSLSYTLRNNRETFHEFDVLRPDGSRTNIESTAVPIHDDQGEMVNAIAVFQDVTERKQLLTQMQKRATELETVAQVSAGASQILDMDRLLQAVSDLTKERFGLYHVHIYLLNETEDTLVLAAGAGEVGRQMVAERRSIPIDKQQSLVARAARTADMVVVNNVRAAADFLPHRLLPNTHAELAVPLVVGNIVLGVLDVQSDTVDYFTDEERQIHMTLASQIAVAVRNAQLYDRQAQTLTKLREMDQMKSSFLANMSHELRTPLNSILGFTEVMLEGINGELNEFMTNDLNVIYKNGRHLLNLINDILDMAKIESGTMRLNLERFNLAEALQEVVTTTMPLARQKGLQLSLAPDVAGEIEIDADRARLRQVLLNLVSNAVKFTEEGGVELDVEREAEGVLISVRDTGAGIPHDQHQTIFQEFHQVDNSSTRKVGGTGLGLAITRHLVEMHGGTIAVESSGLPGEGSVFRVCLPVLVGTPDEQLAGLLVA